MKRGQHFALMSALLAATATAHAADVTSAVADCRAEENDDARLACYDRLADELSPPEAKTASNPPAPPAASPDATPGRTPAAAPAPAMPPAQAQATSPATPPPDDFGYRGGALARADAVAREEAEREQEPGDVEEVLGRVTEVTRRGRGLLVVTLDNGQTWTQKAPDSGFLVQTGDRVRIEAATLGSYLMFREGSKRGTRVTRVR